VGEVSPLFVRRERWVSLSVAVTAEFTDEQQGGNRRVTGPGEHGAMSLLDDARPDEVPVPVPVSPESNVEKVDNETAALGAAWHPVAEAAELGDEPLGVMLLGKPWVIVRLGGDVGRRVIAAFEDRCPHRLAPLSAGFVEDGRLRCRYHGWSFGGDGNCTLIPSNGPGGAIPPRACLARPAGVVERYGLIWLAPDDPVCDLHPFPEWDDHAFDRAWTAPRRTPVGAAQLADNFLDASHFPTVHTSTFGTPEAAYVGPHTVTRDGWEIRTVYEAPYRNHDDPLVATGEHPLVQPHVLTKIGRPATAVRLTLDFPLTGERLAILFACQPESAESTRIYKLMARSGYGGDAERVAELVRYEDLVLDEDLRILERYRHRTLAIETRAEVHTRADRLSVAYRRLLADFVAHSSR
jgi:phenylpropionate dioxygenase-like ring-hydroxylating dioxygenase large terminal subunit